MIQKKVCMVGVFGTGKTCLVQRYVHSIFSAKYHSTVGVKIDRKPVTIGAESVTLLLWDLAGRHDEEDISVSYLRGAHGILYVVDGTRKETLDQAFELQELARGTVGDVPSVIALNKSDLADQWRIGPKEIDTLATSRWHPIKTSAKSGDGVDDAFVWLARAMLATEGEARP
jgi:small GTP-binding protein